MDTLSSQPRHALIVGAGLAGTLMACYLARAGWRVSVYERRPDPRAAGYVGGRSINLALSARGLAGLRGVGLDEVVLANDAIPMRGRMIHGVRRSDERGVMNDEYRAIPSGLGTHHASLITHHFPPPVFQPYSKDPNDAIHSVSRGGLNLTLLNAADAYESVAFIFDHACVDVDLDAPAAIFRKAESGGLREEGPEIRVTADLIIGADGAYSAVRARLQKTDLFDYSQSYLEHGYKELHIPAAEATQRRSDGATKGPEKTSNTEHRASTVEVPHGGGTPDSGPPSLRRFVASSLSGNLTFAMEPHALHIWPRGGSMMIALPNRDGSFTCTLFWPFTGPHGFESLRTPADVRAFFSEHYPDAVPLMPTLAEDYFRNPTSSLVTVRCWPWQHGGNVVLIGDAAHAIVPFYGQGMNAAFEDCLALAECLAEAAEAAERRSDEATKGAERRSTNEHRTSNDEMTDAEDSSGSGPSSLRRSVASSLSPEAQRAALERFQSLRKPNSDAIADMALENFVEMRDKVGDPAFLYKKKLEQTVHALFPERVTPQYNLVSFSTVPYAEARRRGCELDGVLESVIAKLPRDVAAGMTEEAWRGQVEQLTRAEFAARR